MTPDGETLYLLESHLFELQSREERVFVILPVLQWEGIFENALLLSIKLEYWNNQSDNYSVNLTSKIEKERRSSKQVNHKFILFSYPLVTEKTVT